MNAIFKRLCLPWMLINNNVYTFISGIVLSLSTGTINTLCLEKEPFLATWHLYASSLLYTVAGALLIYVASQITSYQVYNTSKQITDRQKQMETFLDFEEERAARWVWIFLTLFLSFIGGTVFLFLNYVL